MKKFAYSLQKILDLRNFELKQAEAELGKVNGQIAQENQKLKEIALSRHNTVQYTDSSPTDFFAYTQTQSYFILLDQKKENCLERIAELEIVAEEKRGIVREAMKKVKVLEKLKEKKHEVWKDEFLKQEELTLDDVVTAQSHNADSKSFWTLKTSHSERRKPVILNAESVKNLSFL